jgi:hypothetical protein
MDAELHYWQAQVEERRAEWQHCQQQQGGTDEAQQLQQRCLMLRAEVALRQLCGCTLAWLALLAWLCQCSEVAEACAGPAMQCTACAGRRAGSGSGSGAGLLARAKLLAGGVSAAGGAAGAPGLAGWPGAAGRGGRPGGCSCAAGQAGGCAGGWA